MDPRYMDFGEVDSSTLYPYNAIDKKKKNCGMRIDLDLFMSVNVLGYCSSLVGGRVQFGSSLLKTDHINT